MSKYHLGHSFKFAFTGLLQAVKTEKNFKVGIAEAIIIVTAGFYFGINKLEWILVIILIGIVLAAELTNSALEVIVDSFTQKEHPGAKLAKDIAAGAVVVLIITAAVAGIIIFIPYL